jgi:hypothetical protein
MPSLVGMIAVCESQMPPSPVTDGGIACAPRIVKLTIISDGHHRNVTKNTIVGAISTLEPVHPAIFPASYLRWFPLYCPPLVPPAYLV